MSNIEIIIRDTGADRKVLNVDVPCSLFAGYNHVLLKEDCALIGKISLAFKLWL